MKFKSILFAAVLAVSGAVAVDTAASAFSLGGFVKGVTRTVGKAAKSVEHGVVREAKAASRTVSKAAKSVGHTAGTVARDAGRAVSKAPKVYMAVAKPVGKVVAAYYRFGAKVVEKTPLKGFAPLARDAARAALSKSGKVGAVVGAGLAVATGGVGSLAIRAGSGAMVGYYGEKGVGIAKSAYKKAATQVRTIARNTSREIRTSAGEIRTSLR